MSSFFGIGKKTVYKILKQNTTKYQTLTNLASSDVDTCVEAGRLLVADLYDPKGSAKSVRLISYLKGSSLYICMTSGTMHFPRNCQLTELN
jgi:predicted DNA-binding transcriptional regulator AlpA